MSITGFKSRVQNFTQTITSDAFLNPNILVLGEKTSAGTAVSEVLVENITSKTDAKTLFGIHSPLYQGIDIMLSTINPNGISRFAGDYKTKINAIPYTVTGTIGVKKIALTGTPVNGKIELYVCSQYKYTISINTTSTDTLSQVATKISDALNTFLDIPVIASVVDNDVLITAYTAGTWFNNCPIEILLNTSSLTLAISQTVQGVGDLNLTNLLSTIASKKFDLIYIPKHLITNDIKEAFKIKINILDDRDYAGIVISHIIDTKDNIVSFISTFKTNIGFAFIAQKTNSNLELPIVSACRYMVQRAIKNTQDADISDFVPSPEVTNGRGNPSYKTTAMSDNILLYHPILRNNFDKTELLVLKDAGCIVLENNNNNTAVIYGCDLTTYSETLEGELAIMRDVANWDAMIAISAGLLNTLKQFVGKTLTTGTPVPNTQQIGIGNISNALLAFYTKMSSKDEITDITYGLLTNDPVNRQEFIDTINRTLKINLVSGTITLDVINAIISPLKAILINSIYKK